MDSERARAEKFQAKLAALSQDFAKRQTRMIADYQKEWTSFLKLSPGRKEWGKQLERLVFIVHSLAGSSGTFGFAEISKVATKIEVSLRRIRDKGSANAGEMKKLGKLLQKLTR